jgi:hypothetical protein
MASVNLYAASVKVSDELELYKRLIFQYSAKRYMSGESAGILRDQLLTLLALYFQYGYSKKTKELAVDVLGVPMAVITSLNFDLKCKQFLVEDRVNKRVKHLNSDLKELLQYTKSVTDGKYYFCFLTSLDNK